MSVGGAEDRAPSRSSRTAGLISLEEQVRRLSVPPVGDGWYYLGEPGVVSDEEYEEFLAQHYADRREGIA